MEKGRARMIPRWATKLGAPALVATALITTSCTSASNTPNQPPISYAAPARESYIPDGPATCSAVAKEAGRNALVVTFRLGSELGVTGGTFTVVEDSIAEGFGVDRKGGTIPRDKVELSDPGDAAASLDITGWAQYGAAGQRSFKCTTDFYPPTSFPEG